MNYIIYVLQSESTDRIYIGSTNNFERRIKEHNISGNGWTKSYHPWKAIYTKSFLTRAEAMREERYLKSLKNREYLLKYINLD